MAMKEKPLQSRFALVHLLNFLYFLILLLKGIVLLRPVKGKVLHVANLDEGGRQFTNRVYRKGVIVRSHTIFV